MLIKHFNSHASSIYIGSSNWLEPQVWQRTNRKNIFFPFQFYICEVFYWMFVRHFHGAIYGIIFSSLIAQTQKYFPAFSAQTQKYFYKKGILPAPIQLSINGLLYSYNKCNDYLHLLSISYPLIRGDFCLGL